MRALSVRELVIEVQQQVQRLGSYKRDQTSEQKIIWRLNTAQDLIVQNSLKPNPAKPERFMIHEPARQAIQGLIQANKRVPVHKETSKRGFAYLPSDLGFLVNDRSVVLEDCKKEFDSPDEPTTYHVTILPLLDSPLAIGSGGFYVNIVARKAVSGSPTIDKAKRYGTLNKKEKFEIIEGVMEQFKAYDPFGVYWEKFDTIYAPESILVVQQLVGTVNTIPEYKLIVDGTETLATTRSITTTKRKSYDGDDVPNRSYQGDFLHDAISHNSYEKPFPNSPVSQLAGNKLYVYSSERFLVPEIILDYVKKPRRISVYLNQTSELDGSLHLELCSKAAELILGDIEATNYGNKVQSNINRIE